MSLFRLSSSSAVIALCLSAPVFAQDRDMADAFEQPLDTRTIVVTGQRLRGQLDVEQAPILELEEADIAAFGVGSIAELVQAIDGQAGSSSGRGGGRPVFLINGIRVSGFREFRSYPPEAIRKVEVLPEEVAQRFGYPPDRRVMNFILKDDYASREIEVEFEAPDRGGYWRNEQEATLLKIANGGRFNATFTIEDTSSLTEGERGVIQAVPPAVGTPDPADFRSLVADSWGAEATVNWAKAYIDTGSSVSLNGTYERAESLRLSGLDPLRAFDPLERRSASDTFSSAGSIERRIGAFQLSGMVDASHVIEKTRVDRRGDPGVDLARSKATAVSSKAVLQGPAFELPAGEVTTTFDLGYDWDRIASEDTRTVLPTRLTRGNLSGGVNILVPITSERRGFLDTIGSISLNGQIRAEHLSDFGTLWRWSGGVTWAPWRNLDLQATYTRRDAPPTLAQLGNPEIVTLNVPVFDFATGQSVLATIVSGGNPILVAETQSDWRFAANWEVPFSDDMRVSVEYIRNRSQDVSSAFPALTPAIEAAFANRVTRAGDGTLLAIDRRPISFAAARANRLVFGLTKRGSFGSASPSRSGGPGRGGGPPRGPSAANPAPAPQNAEPRMGPPGGGVGQNPERFAQMRQALCAAPEGQLPDLGTLPERMAERLRAPDGQIDPERFKEMRERICNQATAAAPSPADPGGARAPQSRESSRGGATGGSGMGFGRDGQGRYFFNLNHAIELDNTVLISQGGTLLDLLDGDGASGFGLSRHTSTLEGGFFKSGKGLRVTGSYTGPSRIAGSGLAGQGDLRFGGVAKLDLRLFADLGELLKREKGVLNDLRLSLVADNIFDARRKVTDSNGDTPLSYQKFLVDPTGRYLGIDLRKMF